MSANHFVVNSHMIGNFQISAQDSVDSTERHPAGTIVDGYSQYWGAGQFIYAKYGGTIAQYGVCALLPTLTSGRLIPVATHVPLTAHQGFPVYIAMVGGSSGDFGWFMRAGVTPINCTASVAAGGGLGITAAGQLGAQSDGFSILGAKNALPATTTVAKTGCIGRSGSYEIEVPDADGWFVGAYLSGTGVGSGAIITSIAPNGRKVTVDTANDAAINGTVTATYNNSTIYYNVAEVNAPFCEGQPGVSNTPATVDIALAASATTDGMDITLTVQDADGNTIAGVFLLHVWISEAATGAGLTGDTYSGDVTVVSGEEVQEITSKKEFIVRTAATGIATMLAVASANPTDQYVCVAHPTTGKAIVSAASGTNWEGV